MKVLRTFLFALLFISFSNIKGGYSIDYVLDYLQENGYYDIIQQIKIYLGDDVAIEVCKQFIATYDCDIIVRVYMDSHIGGGPNHMPEMPPNNPINENGQIEIKASEKFKLEVLKLYKKANKGQKVLIVIFVQNYDTLIKTKDENEILIMIKKMIS